MAIVQISRITQRKGLQQDLPLPLASAELGWATDTRRLFIGNGTLQEGAPVIGNTEVLTEYSDILSYLPEYTYKGESGGYIVQTGLTSGDPVTQSVQSRLDSFAIITDFGATGDGVTDVTEIINNAIQQLFCRDAANPSTRRSLFFPAGRYIISDTISIPPFCTLYGEGADSTIIYFYVQEHTPTTAYPAGTLVSSGTQYYRSISQVPVGIGILDTAYWLDTGSEPPPYIFRTSDSLQQTGVNIGTNSALPPGNIEMSGIQWLTNQIHDGCLIEAASRCVFDNVAIQGPLGQTDLVVASDNVACIRWNSTVSYVCSNIVWNNCKFSGMTYGTRVYEELESCTISNSQFSTFFQGVYLGDPVAQPTGPTGFRLLQNKFDDIYNEGILFVNVSSCTSGNNAFYNVGNHFLGTTNPYTAVIYLGGTNNTSIGDVFERTNFYSNGLHPRIDLVDSNNIVLGQNQSHIELYQQNVADLSLSNQLSVGTYKRVAGIQDVLVDNVSNYALMTFDAAYIRAVKIDYTIVRGADVQTGTYTIVAGTDSSGTGLTGTDSSINNGSGPGVTFSVTESSDTVTWEYSTTSTGSPGSINYSITTLA